MKKTISLLLPLLLMSAGVFAQGINFFQGTFEEALKAAKEQNKNVYVDFYAVWCGPCKKMSAEAFPDPRVGAYFNEKFVAIKIDAESATGKPLADKYEVKAYPTSSILDAEGQELASVEGAMNAAQLLKWARTEMGDLLSYEQMYDQLKTDKSPELVRDLLLGAPDFLAKQPEGSTRERWLLRVERLYSDYRKQHPLAELMNPEDFPVLMAYHQEAAKGDEVMEYIVKNYDDVTQKVGKDKVNIYLFGLSGELIAQLASKGDMDYEKYLDRIKGDLKPCYDALMKNETMDSYTTMKYLNDAVYYIYNKKDVAQYISLMDNYLGKLGTFASSGDFRSATDNMYDALDGKLPENAARKGIEWIGKALQEDKLDVGAQMEMLIMNGDLYKMLQDKDNAMKCYKQAYAVSLQFQNPGISMQIKAMMDNLQ